jgi:hypothetical protein
MKFKILFLTFLFLPVLAMADSPGTSPDIHFYSEDLLRCRQSMEEQGYTSARTLRERLAKLSACVKDRTEERSHLWGRGYPEIGPFSRRGEHFDASRKTTGFVDIPDMLVNEEMYASSFNQSNPSVCMFPDLSFITAWEDERNGDIDVLGQRYTFAGNPEGANLELGDEDFPKDQFLPKLAILDNSSFVAIWIDEETFEIRGRRFTKELSPLGESFGVSDSPIPYTTWSPAVSSDSNGKFVVVWSDTRSGNNIYARRFDREGNPLGIGIQVNDDDGSKLHISPQVSAGFSGDFAIVWEDFRNTDADIYAQRFDSSGTKLGGNVLINLDSLNEDQYTPSVAVGPQGRFMVAWVDLRWGDEALFSRSLSFEFPTKDTLVIGITAETTSVVQETPPIVVDTLGRFTLAWVEYAPPNPAIYAQRFDSLGQGLGVTITVSNLQSISERHSLSLGASPGGSFVAAWMDKQTGNYDIFAQRINSFGFPQGENLIVNDDQMGANQSLPRIATRSDGSFMVAWEDLRRGTRDIFIKRLDQDAQALGDDFMVNDSTGRIYHGKPDVACDSPGNSVVVWEDARGGSVDIFAQMFDEAGNPDGENFRVSCLGSNINLSPGCDMSPDGNFVVVWSSTGGNGSDIYGRLFSPDGSPLDTFFEVNDDTESADQLSPQVCMNDSGGFVVAWVDRRGGQDRIYLQRFTPDGTKLDTNFAVSTDRTDPVQYQLDLDVNPDGDFIVAWTELYLSSSMIFAQRYNSSGSPVDDNVMVVEDLSAYPANPRVDFIDDERFVVAWEDFREQGSDIFYQTFSNGLPQGPNIKVNNDPYLALQNFPDIDVWDSHLYSVWRDNRIPGWGFSIFFNRIDLGQTWVEEQEGEGSFPSDFALYQNHPNPFNSYTSIQYTVSGERNQSVPVSLRIYNVLGRLVRTLVDDCKSVGTYRIDWDGKDNKGQNVSSGIYLYQLRVGDHVFTKRMLLLK